jgi:hypothetical protein
MKGVNSMRRILVIVLVCLILGATLGGLLFSADAQGSPTIMTFSSLGFNTATGSKFTIDFPSSYLEATGKIDIHLQTLNSVTDLTVTVNGAQIYLRGDYPGGEQGDSICIPVGVVDQGTNTLVLSFSFSVTLYEDSCITLYKAYKVQISLTPGWNMVSIPLKICNNSKDSVFPGVAAVYTWNPISKSYVTPTTIEPEIGYWVAVTANKTIVVTGTPVLTWIRDDIKAGWNMIGSVITKCLIIV